MKKIFTLTYVIGTAVVAITTTFMQVQPALLLIDLMAPNEGDKFSLKLVFLLTWLLLLLPFVIVAVILFFIRKNADSKIIVNANQTGVWIHRQKKLQNALIGVPVFIDDQKVGVVDNGRDKFFELNKGKFIIYAGEGKGVSEKTEVMINAGQQLKFDLEVASQGFIVKYILTRK